jgi:AcrR family transcriptional regulator
MAIADAASSSAATRRLKHATTGGGSRSARVDRQTALLEAALELFTTRPYEDISVDELCARAGVAHGLLSYHFESKRGLFAAAVRKAWDELIEFERPLESEVTVVERFRGYLFRQFEYFRRYPGRFRLMTRSGHLDDQVAEVLKAARQDAVRDIEAFMGCPNGAHPRLRAAIAGWAGFVDTVTQEYLENTSMDIGQITDVCAQVLVSAVRSANDVRLDAEVELDAMMRVMSGANGVGHGTGTP